jgi:hypothetical protein
MENLNGTRSYRLMSACVSGSEPGAGPRYVSLENCEEEPSSS